MGLPAVRGLSDVLENGLPVEDALASRPDLPLVAHTLERLADRTTNIAERVIFIATNVVEQLNP